MKKALLSLGLGLLATAASAQVSFPVRIGFENADKSAIYHSKYANKVGLSEFGDWVNPHQDTDVWTEQAQGEQKNGEYCFMAQNTDKLNPWDRGFKLANLPIKENTPYRMSFWVKGTEGNVITAWLSKGVEQLDKSMISSSNSGEYGINQKVMSGEWEHMSFVAFYENPTPYNNWLANTSWAGGAIVGDNIPESLWEGAGVNDSNKDKTYRDFFNNAVPEEFFAIVNMFDGGTYLLDDICIEEGVYFNQATGNLNIIRLDFGYDTNIKTLVAATKKGQCLMLDKEQFKVNGADGEVLEIASVEAHADGYVYVFLADAWANNATVSFTPNDECPLEYAGNRQPTSDFTQTIKVKGFQNEVIYDDETIDVETHNTALPEMDSCYPENGSFDLPETTNTFTFIFDTPVDPAGSIATLEGESGTIGELELSNGADEKTLVAKYNGNLKKGSYTIKMEVANNAGDAQFYDDETNPAYKFSIGATGFDPDLSSEVIFDSKFDEDGNNAFPLNGSIISGDDGSVATPGEGRGSGPRIFNDVYPQLYLRDWAGSNFYYEIGTREDQRLELAEGINKLSFKYAMWKEGAQNLHVEVFPIDEEGNAGENIFDETFTENLNVNGDKGAMANAPKAEIKLNIDAQGNYGIRFKGTGEYLISDIIVEYLPNIAGIDSKTMLYKSYLAALTRYEDTCDTERYNEKDMENLYSLIQKYEDFGKWSTELQMYAPSQYEAAAKELDDAVKSLNEFIVLVDQYDKLRVADGDIQTMLDEYAENKVAKLQCYADLKAAFEEYKDKALTDKEELKAAYAALNDNMIMVKNMNGVDLRTSGGVGMTGIPAYTYTIDLAIKFIESTGIELSDEEKAIVEAGKNALTDDDVVLGQLRKVATNVYYKAMSNEETANAFFAPKDVLDEDGEVIDQTAGIYDFSFFLKNPNIYIQTTQEQIAQSLEEINLGTEDEPFNVYAGPACPGWTFSEIGGWSTWSTGWTDYKNAAYPVEAMASNWGGTYTISQSIENLPAGLYILKGGVSERDAFHDDSYFFWQTSADDDIVILPVPNNGQSFPNLNMSSARINGNWVEGNESYEEGEEAPADELLEILDGKLTIGAHAGATDSHIFINSFQIQLVGKSAAYDYAKGYTDDIKNVQSKLSNVTVYDINGRQMVRATKGVNIVKRTYSDGSVKVDKYIVK
ncbi:MAG: hypothetical protein MJZ35_06495 [Bacteroidaceae bacterium]|nr:hypothetical protein [Bacteroidaceae bacterium]